MAASMTGSPEVADSARCPTGNRLLRPLSARRQQTGRRGDCCKYDEVKIPCFGADARRVMAKNGVSGGVHASIIPDSGLPLPRYRRLT